jgi:hypothetical protein
MPPFTLHIKNMVCIRCKNVADEELIKMGMSPISIELGKVELNNPLDEKDIKN